MYVPQAESNRCAKFSIKCQVKFRAQLYRRTAAQYVGTGPTYISGIDVL